MTEDVKSLKTKILDELTIYSKNKINLINLDSIKQFYKLINVTQKHTTNIFINKLKKSLNIISRTDINDHLLINEFINFYKIYKFSLCDLKLIKQIDNLIYNYEEYGTFEDDKENDKDSNKYNEIKWLYHIYDGIEDYKFEYDILNINTNNESMNYLYNNIDIEYYNINSISNDYLYNHITDDENEYEYESDRESYYNENDY